MERKKETKKVKKEAPSKKPEESGLLQRLKQASAEGIVMSAAINTIIPGAGLAVNSLKGIKGAKKVAKVAGKSAAKEGIKMMDDAPENENKLEDLSEDFALEIAGRSLGR